MPVVMRQFEVSYSPQLQAASCESSGIQGFINKLGAAEDASLQLDPAGRVVSRFFNCEIASAFQGIHGAQNGVVAWQAFARVRGADDSHDLSPWRLFARAASDEDLVAMDRRCRLVHALNFFRLAEAATLGDLHLCVHDRLLSAVSSDHGRAYRRVLDSLGVDHRRIVIELPALPVGNEYVLAQVAASYRLNGFRIALNPVIDAQLGSLLNRIRVDAVKVNAQDLPNWHGAGIEAARSAVADGTRLIAKRVETEQQRQFAIEAGATHLQGYLMGHPEPGIPNT